MFTSAGNLFSQRDIVAPLIPKSDAYDEESPPDKWFKASSAISDSAPAEKLSMRGRGQRKAVFLLFSKWGRFCTLLMFAGYGAVVVMASLQSILPATGRDALQKTSIAVYLLWELALIFSLSVYLSGRMSLAWGGLYKTIFFVLSQGVTIAFLMTSYRESTVGVNIGGITLGQILPVFLATTLYTERKVLKPAFRKLHMYYQGLISEAEMDNEEEEEGDKPPRIAGIGSDVLQKVARNACTALDIPSEAAETVDQLLHGQRIRQGKDEAADDWFLTIKKITKAVSFAPFKFCRSKSSITSEQCHDVVCQMIIYLRQYIETGKIEDNEAILKRTAPLSFAEAFGIMLKFSMKIPFSFLIALLPRTLINIAQSYFMVSGGRSFVNGVMMQDFEMARRGYITILIATGVQIVLANVANYFESTFTAKLGHQIRSSMRRSMLKGGTAFEEKHRPGSLTNAFSGHLAQIELYCQTNYVSFFPNIVSLVSGMIVATQSYPFAIVMFISLVPIIFAADYFTNKASKTSSKSNVADGKFMGKISSVITCQKAVRACDAGDWVSDYLQDVMDEVKKSHFYRFLDSGNVQNFNMILLNIVMFIITGPLGLQVLNGKAQIGDFNAVNSALMNLMQPIMMVGFLQGQTLQFSGCFQAVKELSDDSLDEEGPSDTSGKVELPPLKSSVKLRGIKFRYNPKQAPVLNNVNIDGIDKGTYNVILGESGSGKTTVLNLLMRFRKQYEGSIKWDETDIFSTSLKSFRKQVSVMFQQTMILQATIRDNILFGSPEVPGLVEQAAKDAEVHDVIERLPDGYDTVIGGDALAGLSGGQQQRLCLARALYRRPAMLLLDEATSALDKETETSIINTIVNLRDKEGMTVVSVTHHPSTAVKADKIIVLRRGGTVAEEGVYDELVSKDGGIFKRMVNGG